MLCSTSLGLPSLAGLAYAGGAYPPAVLPARAAAKSFFMLNVVVAAGSNIGWLQLCRLLCPCGLECLLVIHIQQHGMLTVLL
jgi:hypothetical protein